MTNKLLLFLLSANLYFQANAQQSSPEQRAIISIERIWDRASHNAFTDLVFFKEKLYCTFREGTGHVPGDKGINGTIRVIATADGQNWYSAAHLAEKEVDLRDPKLSVTPEGRLMLNMGGSFYQGKQLLKLEPRVAFSDEKGSVFYDPEPVEVSGSIATNKDWLWRIAWKAGQGYGMIYQSLNENWKLHLVKTKDGLSYENVQSFEIVGNPSEAALRFLPDQSLVALLRRDAGDRMGYIGHSRPPYRSWTWNSLSTRLGGPHFIQLPDGRLLCGTRDYEGEERKTILAFITLDGRFEKVLTLPSGGDTSYPGMALKDDVLYVSYYAGHEGKTAIYLAKIWWERL